MSIKPISDDDLILLYYGEHDDPDLARRVATDATASERLRELGEALSSLDQAPIQERGEEYGAEVWQRLAPSLAEPERPGLLSRISRALTQPRLSLAGLASVFLVAALAFWIGRESAPPMLEQNIAFNGQRLLSARVAMHLADADRLLTQVARHGSAVDQQSWADTLALSNRLYRHAARSQGERQLVSLLDELEPLLLELANQQQSSQPAALIDDTLLFKLRVMRQQLEPQRNTRDNVSNPSSDVI